MTADRWSNLLAFLAGVVGLAVVIRTWPRRPRRAQIARLRHPSTPPPVGFVLDISGEAAHWRVVTSAASSPTTVDIVTWQEVGTGDDWRSEPIIEPIVLEPGESALLPLVVDDPASAHLVVVAWTVRHPGGDVQGSRTMTIGATSSMTPAAVPANRGWTLLVASALVAGLLVVLMLVAGWRVIDRDGVEERAAPSPIATAPPITPLINPSSPDSSAPPSTSNITAATSSTIGASTEPSTTFPSTTSSTTSSTTTTTTSTTTTTRTTRSTTAASTTTRSESDGRSIDVRGRVEDCRFGADCVIASFSALGFPAEGEYVCEFADGSRFTFRYAGGGAIDACATSGESPSITIEIDGVRSATITRDAPEGV